MTYFKYEFRFLLLQIVFHAIILFGLTSFLSGCLGESKEQADSKRYSGEIEQIAIAEGQALQTLGIFFQQSTGLNDATALQQLQTIKAAFGQVNTKLQSTSPPINQEQKTKHFERITLDTIRLETLNALYQGVEFQDKGRVESSLDQFKAANDKLIGTGNQNGVQVALDFEKYKNSVRQSPVMSKYGPSIAGNNNSNAAHCQYLLSRMNEKQAEAQSAALAGDLQAISLSQEANSLASEYAQNCMNKAQKAELGRRAQEAQRNQRLDEMNRKLDGIERRQKFGY